MEGTTQDWNPDAAMHGAFRQERMPLTEVVVAVTGIRYLAVAQAVKRLAASLEKDAARRKCVLR